MPPICTSRRPRSNRSQRLLTGNGRIQYDRIHAHFPNEMRPLFVHVEMSNGSNVLALESFRPWTPTCSTSRTSRKSGKTWSGLDHSPRHHAVGPRRGRGRCGARLLYRHGPTSSTCCLTRMKTADSPLTIKLLCGNLRFCGTPPQRPRLPRTRLHLPRGRVGHRRADGTSATFGSSKLTPTLMRRIDACCKTNCETSFRTVHRPPLDLSGHFQRPSCSRHHRRGHVR